MVQASDFYYELPQELIAQEPLPERSASRMLILHRQRKQFSDALFIDLPRYLCPGDCLVLNNTRVFPARLHGRRNSEHGAAVELFLLRALDEPKTLWRALVRPAKRTRTGDRIVIDPALTAEVVQDGERGERVVRLYSEQPIERLLERLGDVPLPPDIRRPPETGDRDRYQTVFAAREAASVAAPTAGLHFTPEILAHCRQAGADLAYVTLHVGLGTFAPLPEGDLANAVLHEEYFEISDQAATQLSRAQRRVCVGTTSVRTIESAQLRGTFGPLTGETNLFIQPRYRFRATNALLTNFHLPGSSLLMLVCAFAGTELTLAAYRHAVQQRYRFFSYGDCMLIL